MKECETKQQILRTLKSSFSKPAMSLSIVSRLLKSNTLHGNGRRIGASFQNLRFQLSSKATNEIPLEAQFKNPIVAKLWAARQEAKQRLSLSDTGSTSSTDVSRAAAAVLQEGRSSSNELRGRTPSESATEIMYPFSNDLILREAYQSPWGEMRIGKVSVNEKDWS